MEVLPLPPASSLQLFFAELEKPLRPGWVQYAALAAEVSCAVGARLGDAQGFQPHILQNWVIRHNGYAEPCRRHTGNNSILFRLVSDLRYGMDTPKHCIDRLAQPAFLGKIHIWIIDCFP